MKYRIPDVTLERVRDEVAEAVNGRRDYQNTARSCIATCDVYQLRSWADIFTSGYNPMHDERVDAIIRVEAKRLLNEHGVAA